MSSPRSRRAHAKVNLRLRVGGVRADGYHSIDTWLAPLADLYDDVQLAEAPPGAGVTVRCPGAPELEGAENLAARAARAWAAARGVALDAEIVLTKRIPVAAGLGGGSSDAAAVLRLLEERAAGAALGGERLHAVAAQLGADVPFFLGNGPARATGIGERLAPAPSPAWRWAAVAKPARGLKTADVYARLDARRAGGDPGGGAPGGDYGNDLQEAALELCPEIAGALAALRGAGAAVAQVSGSGSASFGLFADEAGARGAADALARLGLWNAVSRVRGGDE